MMHRRILCATGLYLAASAAGAQPPILGQTTDQVRARDGNEITLEYGHIEVPENRMKDGSRAISVAFVRARTPAAEPGPPVFVLAGGPGGSSIQMVERYITGGGHRFFELIGGDVVGIDQRGVGRSEPNLDTDTRYRFSPEEPGDPRVILNHIQKVCRDEAARWRAQGVDLDGYNTVESADDIDAVRRALGYDKITLWGASYGSHLAMATMRRHGEYIARALLPVPEGPDHTVKLPSYAQHGLERIAELVAADDSLGGVIPDLLGTLEKVLDRLDREPVRVEVDGQTVGLSKFDVQQWIAVEISTDVAKIAAVPAAIHAMAQGNFEAVARDVLAERRSSGIYTAMGMAMDAASGMTAARAELIAREADTCLLGDAMVRLYPGTSEAWDVPDLGDAFRGPLATDIPVLFIVGDLDSRTPPRNAEELMAHMPNARMITVANAAHGLPMGIPELRQAWGDFLNGREVTLERVDAGPIQFVLPEGAARAVPANAIALTPEQLAPCAGNYRFPNGMVFEVRAAEARLICTIPGKGDFDLWPEADARFFCENPNIPTLTFVKDAAGKVVAVEGGGLRGNRVE